MPDNIISLAEQNLITVSGQRNAVLRGNAVARLWIAEGVFVDAERVHNGRRDIARAAGALLARYPEYEFWTLQAVDSIPGVCRLAWAFGTTGLAPALTGLDVVRIDAERILAVYRFINGAAF